MEIGENKRFVYEFGKFVLDPNEKTLFSAGVPIRLPAKEFETLLLLVENNGRALTKDEMIAAVWQDTFVEEGNLAKQISKLRKIFNTNGDRFIETLPKHGYRFTADLRLGRPADADPVIIERQSIKRVTVAYHDDADDQGLLPPPPGGRGLLQTPAFQRSRWPILAAVVLLVCLAAGVAYFWGRTPQPAQGTAAIRSIAVLPFKIVVAEDGDDYLRLGLTDALITKLSGLKQIVVRPTNAVRKYGDGEPIAAGRELSVDAVLDGNVQRIGQQIRVTVQLVDVRDGRLLWGGKFDEKFTDIFEVQDTISAQVARAIVPGLTGDEKSLLAKRYTTNSEAHNAYVMGRIFWNKRTASELDEAVKYFKVAIAKDPNYALAYAGLADSYNLLPDYQGASGPQVFDDARAAAMKALALDDQLAEAHTSLAYVSMYRDWDWRAAEAGYRRAIALNPNYATAHQWYSEYLGGMGRFDEALIEIRLAKEIDPLAPVINAGEVWILYFARRYDEAIDLGVKLREMSPAFAEVHEYLKRCYDQKRMYREAITARQMRRKLVGVDAAESAVIKRAAAAETHEIYWRSRLEQEFIEMRNEGASAFDMAEIYAQLGEKEKAFEWLEKAFAQRTYTMMYLKVAPNLDPLRSDPRFTDMLRRVGLAQG